MKEEDMDWLVYHQIPEGTSVTVESLVADSGLGIPDVDASLVRLERYCLVERTDSSVRLLSHGEALIRNQLNYAEDLPFMIENGVIKQKKRQPCPEKK